MHFSLFHYYLPLEKGWSLHLKKFEFPLPKDALCKFGWIWHIGSEEQDFKISSIYFRYLIRNYMYIPLEKGVALYLNELESPLPKDSPVVLPFI